jgi:fatty acyl-CoA reductase
LLKIAEESPKFEAFLQVSSCFVNCDKTGFIEEQIYTNVKFNWKSKYDQILQLNKRDLVKNANEIMLPFPNAYSFTKRMAEHLLMEGNTKNIPITFIRPSIIGAAADEPCIGWTDTYGLLSGVALLTGLGILKDMTGNENNIADVIPVDYVAKQLLVQTAFAHNLHRSSQGQKNYFLTHCGTSSVNPVNWKYYFESMISYQNDFPYDRRVGKAGLAFHRTDQSYKLAYRLKSVIPTYTLFYLSRVLGTKSFKEKITELKGAVDQCFTIKQELTYYASNEWIFDCSNTA